MDRTLSVFELAQQFAQTALDELIAAMVARGYEGVCLPDVRLCWACADGIYSVQALARKLGVTKQYCAREVTKLKDEGYLEVMPDPDDARALRVTLSAAGRGLLEAIAEEKGRIEARISEEIGTKRMSTLAQTLRHLTQQK